MSEVEVVPFGPAHAAAVARLATTVQWPSLTDPAVVAQVCAAPGSVSYVALAQHGPRTGAVGAPHPGTDGRDGTVVGWAQALADGVLQAHLSFLAVHPDHRRRGIGRLLVVATFQATGAKRMDLVTDEDAAGFWEDFGHRRMRGFRIYPGA